MKGYSSARDEYKGKEGIFLDANENPFGHLNRYPDPQQKKLKELLAELKGVNSKNIFIGNGSDEVIDLAFRIFCTPGKDKALTFSLEAHLRKQEIKLIFICSPNNPTGNLIKTSSIESILEKFNGIVIIDEAYIDFSESDSMISLINKYDNLIVSQTMSKAWGLAAARVGIAYANEEIIQLYNKVKPPYNISQPNQTAAIETLNNLDVFKKNMATINEEKEKLREAFTSIKKISKIYPSDANFLLIEINEADKIYESLIEKKIITRNRSRQVPNCLRISIGTPSENKQLINELKNI